MKEENREAFKLFLLVDDVDAWDDDDQLDRDWSIGILFSPLCGAIEQFCRDWSISFCSWFILCSANCTP